MALDEGAVESGHASRIDGVHRSGSVQQELHEQCVATNGSLH